jgi:aminopeptidase N
MERQFKYYPENFGELTVKVLHMDLVFDIYDDHTIVESKLRVRNLDKPLSDLELNAKDLEIREVSCSPGKVIPHYDRASAKLHLKFEPPLDPRKECVISTKTVCRPTSNILEGLYYDKTPPGAPPTQITQCQQWGFQRIVPCIDDMTAKCTYITTIIADSRYTTMISNGDVSKPRSPAGNGRDMIQYANTITPMAPYLFFLGVGTYDTHFQECEYPDGRSFMLELLIPPGSDPSEAGHALDVLADAVVWVWLFTGPDQYTSVETRKRLLSLCKERDAMKKSGNDPERLKDLKNEIKKLSGTIKHGYAYTGTVYREIGMQNSDFGGMENVGNTTITTNRIMPFSRMTDPSFEYMVRVKVHEFYHNLNGSEVTGWSPFEIWLNEAVTVHIEEQYHRFLFGEEYGRLQTVLSLLSPGVGTFALDRGAGAMPVEPDGFNDPNELITAVTYVKAPEFVRMIETLMGKELFTRGLDLYHRRYRHKNATGSNWLMAMEEVSGMDFSGMSQVWLKKTGFPIVKAVSSYDKGKKVFSLSLVQSPSRGGDIVWEFPFRMALVDKNGSDIIEITQRIRKSEERIIIKDVEEPAYLSLNRGYSFYGKTEDNATPDELHLQVKTDPDIINRFIAYYRILDSEKMRLLDDPSAVPDPEISRLFYNLLSDQELMARAGAQFLTIFESVEDQDYAHRYQALYDVKKKIQRSVAGQYSDPILSIYEKYSGKDGDDGYLPSMVTGIRRRQVKNTCLSILASRDTPEIHALIRRQFVDPAAPATDRLVAFSLYLDSSAPDKHDVLKQFGVESRSHPVSWETYLSAVAGSSSDDIIDMVAALESSDDFHIEQANEQRALYGRFAMNRKKSLQTVKGRQFLTSMLVKLAQVNEYSTVMALQAFSAVDFMEQPYRADAVKVLADLLASLDPEKTPSVYNTAKRLLKGLPNACREYEEKFGDLPVLL